MTAKPQLQRRATTMAKRKQGFKILTIQTPLDLAERLRAVAKANSRSVNGEVIFALKQHVASQEAALARMVASAHKTEPQTVEVRSVPAEPQTATGKVTKVKQDPHTVTPEVATVKQEPSTVTAKVSTAKGALTPAHRKTTKGDK
jgi:hypothetical protein